MKLLYTLILTCFLASSAQAIQLPGLDDFVEEMVARHHFDREELKQAFGQAQYRHAVINAISTPATRKPWPEYRAAFVNAKRIRHGLTFWQTHEATLARASQQYGVPAEIIVALIGVETVYGRQTGKFPTLDALTTLAFDFPRRTDFFRGELEQYLLLAREQRFELSGVRGSYAGALGIPQFMPGSYRRYAVDFNGDGRTDLLHDPEDAIGSVAHYLQQYGWQPQQPVAVRATLGEDGDAQPGARRALSDWQAHRVTPTGDTPADPQLAAQLLDFTVPDGKEYWLGFRNFEVITQYNNSTYYAMTVHQLASALRAAYTEGEKP
jgi:membrane-bound lytic murein transglycosylase B